VSDRDDIIALTIDYTWALDTKQLDRLRDIFADDATASLHGVDCDGVDAIIARIGGAITRLDATQHLIGNHQVAVDGDTATCRCQLHSQHVLRGTEGGDNFVVGGYYSDQLRRTPGGWRITHRVMAETWRSGNVNVVKRV
jgi:ketosteroid isomerase-like protein